MYAYFGLLANFVILFQDRKCVEAMVRCKDAKSAYLMVVAETRSTICRVGRSNRYIEAPIDRRVNVDIQAGSFVEEALVSLGVSVVKNVAADSPTRVHSSSCMKVKIDIY